MLRTAIGNAYGLDPERIVCGSGSDELLNLLMPAAIMFLFNNLLFGIGEIFHSNVWWSRAFAFRDRIAPELEERVPRAWHELEVECVPFRITRNADMSVREDLAEELHRNEMPRRGNLVDGFSHAHSRREWNGTE